jgi:hypothetical protein
MGSFSAQMGSEIKRNEESYYIILAPYQKF